MSGSDEQRDRLMPPPDETDPSLRFSRYIVEPRVLGYAGVDHWAPEQLEAAKATGWLVLTREELLAKWRERSE